LKATDRVGPAADLKDKAYKRAFDLAFLLAAHVLLLPLWLLLWTIIPLMILIDDGRPIFFKQSRIGKKGKVFDVYKFRTMVRDAEAKTGPVWATANDPRITKFGRILRSTALDEMPQVINILKGDMSFVGPRAERPELHRQFASRIQNFDLRLTVRPGLTGLAQISGAYNMKPEDKLKHDLEYIRVMSPIVDSKLIIKSAFYTVFRKWDERESSRTKT